MKEPRVVKEPRAKRITDFDITTFAANPDLRKLPELVRRFIKFRVFTLKKLKWGEKEIACSLGISIPTVRMLLYRLKHLDREYEDLRIFNVKKSRFTHRELGIMMSHEEL
jgi:hypothetical protein